MLFNFFKMAMVLLAMCYIRSIALSGMGQDSSDLWPPLVVFLTLTESTYTGLGIIYIYNIIHWCIHILEYYCFLEIHQKIHSKLSK